ncbi:MAG: methyltransferase [Chitinophagaceae bacterium]|nr:methyltransferase [Chitinophagaceae bacterium]
MRIVLKHIVARTYRPMLVKYLSKTRRYNYKDIELEIPPEVFHPGFFSSTQLLLRYIDTFPLQGKTFLELGAGSGLIAIHAAKKNAVVTASDINPVAIEYLRKNSSRNKVKIEMIQSDLFKNILPTKFDTIAINPPYYKKQPQSLLDHAWYCGENGEYFTKLFEQLTEYVHESSAVIMVLCDGCDIAMIEKAAATNGFNFQLMQTKQYLLEKNFIYKIGRK